MSTRTLGPLGIEYDDTSAAELAIVSRDTFKRLFETARRVSPIIRESTSDMDGEPYLSRSTYRLSLDGRSGYVVRPDGELVYVFSLWTGRGDGLVKCAIRDGASHLDCFDGYLPEFYARHGFTEYRREANWTPGGPDVVFMATPERLAR